MADGRIIATNAAPGSGGGSGPAAPGNFTIGALSPRWNPEDNTELWIDVPVTPPSPLGTITGGHIYVEIPDQSSGTTATLDNSSSLDGTADLTGNWNPIDLDQFPYNPATLPWVAVVPNASALITGPTPIRVRVVAYSNNSDPAVSKSTPSATVTVSPYAPAKPGSGVEFEPLVGGITAEVLPDENSTGVLRVPIAVTVSLAGLPNPLPPHFAYELVLTFAGEDPRDESQVHVATGALTTGGLVPSGPDGVTIPHTLLLDKPTENSIVTIWARSIRVDGGVVTGKNSIVPDVTPYYSVLYGGGPTLDASMLRNVGPGITVGEDGLLQVHNGDGIALGTDGKVHVNPGVGLTIDSSGFLVFKPSTGLAADGTGAYIPGGAITNALLADLAVGAAKIQNGAVGTAKFVAASVTTAIIANAAVTNALLGFAVVGTANIQNAAITNALIANLAVGTANIADLAVTDAKIISLSVSKLTAGTITATISINAPTINGGSLNGTSMTLTLNGITTTVNNLTDVQAGFPCGLKVVDGAGVTAVVTAGQFFAYRGTGGIHSVSVQAYNTFNGVSRVILTGASIFTTVDITCGSTPQIAMNGNRVLTSRQPDPGAPSFASVSDAQLWCSNLRNSLRNHGMI